MEKPPSDSDSEEVSCEEDILFCDVCEEDFYSQGSYDHHVRRHRTCGIDGCQYIGVEESIEKHIEMQHLTGLYDKIRNVNTPEDIAKWVEERKARYPTKENVQKRYERQEEMLKRGEKIRERKNRFGKDKSRLVKVPNKKQVPKKAKKHAKATPQKKPKESLIDEKSDWNGTMFPFRGTKQLFGTDADKETSDYDDDEWAVDTASKVTVKLNNALGALMGAYMSEEEEGEAPAEEKIERQQTAYPIEDIKEEVQPVKRAKKRKVFHRKKQNKIPKKDNTPDGFSRIKFVKRRVTLLERLLDSEIRHERNVLLQCVQYVVTNNFFRDSN